VVGTVTAVTTTGQVVVLTGMLDVTTLVLFALTMVLHVVPQMVETVLGSGGQLDVVAFSTFGTVGGKG